MKMEEHQVPWHWKRPWAWVFQSNQHCFFWILESWIDVVDDDDDDVDDDDDDDDDDGGGAKGR